VLAVVTAVITIVISRVLSSPVPGSAFSRSSYVCMPVKTSIPGGITHGATDELGYLAVEDVVSVPDLHATMLYLLGIDNTKLTFKLLGRDFRLTDVHGEVVKTILT